MTDPRETLAGIKEQADKATDGPWKYTGRDESTTWIEGPLEDVLIHDERGHGHMRENFTWIKRPNAEFIAASRTTVPRLVGALQAVLDLHQPRTEHVITGDCSMEQCEHEEAKDCPKTPFEVCVRCYAIAEEVDSYFMEDHIDISAYPCAEYRAITDQLGDDR